MENRKLDSPSVGEIHPERSYTLSSLSSHLGVTQRWIKEELILSGELQHTTRGKFLIVIKGQWFINWVEANSTFKQERANNV